MQVTTTAERPFEKCYLDVVGPLLVTVQGNRYILTFQDDLSKYVIAVPLEKQDAETIARAFVERIVLLYGTPQIVQTDQGINFMSEVFRDTCSLLKIKKIQSTSFHPESQGSIERSHRVLAEYLCHYVSEDQTDWDSGFRLQLTCITRLSTLPQATRHLSYCLDAPQPYHRH